METYIEELEKIRKLLSDNPRGLTISEISEKIDINRNSVAKYMDVLRVNGVVEKKMAGPSKIFFLFQRMPISAIINTTTDAIIMFDNFLKVIKINENVNKLIPISKKIAIGDKLDEEPLKSIFSELIPDINKALKGKEVKKEIKIIKDNKNYFFDIKLIPVLFEDRSSGLTLIIDDITQRKENEQKIERLASFPELNPNAIIEIDKDYNVTYCNKRALKLLEDLGISDPKDLLHKDTFGILKTSIEEEESKSFYRELKIKNKTFGESIYVTKKYNVARIYISDITERKENEDKLKNAYETLKLSQYASKWGVFNWDIQKDTVTWTDELYELFCLDKDKVKPSVKNWLKIIHPEDKEKAYNNLKDSLSNNKRLYNEYRVIKPDNKIRWIYSTGELFLSDNKPIRMLGICIDVTEKKEAEESMRRSKARDELLSETMLQGVVHQDYTGKIISMNPAAIEILGKTPEEFLGESSVSVEHDCILENGDIFPGTEHPSMVSLKTGKKIKDVIMGVFNPREKRYRWISISAVPLFMPGKEKPHEVFTVFEDITEKKEAEKELKKSEALFKGFYENSPIALELYDHKGNLIHVNQATLDIYGIKDIKDLSNYNLFDEPNLSEKQKKLILEGKQLRFYMEYDLDKIKKKDYYKTSKSGKIYIEATITKICSGDSSAIGYIIQVQDITDWKNRDVLIKLGRN